MVTVVTPAVMVTVAVAIPPAMVITVATPVAIPPATVTVTVLTPTVIVARGDGRDRMRRCLRRQRTRVRDGRETPSQSNSAGQDGCRY